MNVSDLDVELIAELASEVSRELSPKDIRLVVDMAKKMGPDLSAGEIQMISKMAPDLEQHDVEMIAQVFHYDILNLISNKTEFFSTLII